MSERGANDFRERARVEADRYGPDPWIFVRELLQNARDAGARAVVITVEEQGGLTRIRCHDDGEGMTYEHARRYLFSLYASSKEDRANQVGRFGVGFWSILRFDPERIVIRSAPQGGAGAWQVVLDGELRHAQRAAIEMTQGTEVVLERARRDGADERRVFEAAHQNARFLCLRDEPDTPLPITINGRSVNAEFALSRPSSAFRRGHVRGVVGLGSAPRVELFSRGLRVRSAACLDDLLSNTGYTNHSRVRFPELPGGLAPQALLESDGLELLLSRSDARDTRTLRRLVKLGQNELRQLVEHQLAQIRPPGIGERLTAGLRWLAGESTWWRAVLGALSGALLAVIVAKLIWPDEIALRRGQADAGAQTVDRKIYNSIYDRYKHPGVVPIGAEVAEPLDLRYGPRDARPYFAAAILDRVTGMAEASSATTPVRYPSRPCASECIDVALPIAARGGEELPLPIPSGQQLEVASLEFVTTDSAGAIGDSVLAGPKRVYLSTAGEAVLALDWSFRGTLRYRTGPGKILTRPPRSDSALPPELAREARALAELPLRERVDAAIGIVRDRVAYSTSEQVTLLHNTAIARRQDFVSRTLEIGAGDCDIQNGLLVAVLHAADVDARLAIGWVGGGGRVETWLHAWVEYAGEDDTWQIADATARASGGSSLVSLPSPPANVAVGNLDRRPRTPGPNALDPGADPADPAGELPSAPGPSSDPSAAGNFGQLATGPDSPQASEPSVTDRLPPELVELLARPWIPWLALGSGLLGLGLLGLSISRRTARRFNLDDSGDLSSLLQGALAQPAAFRHLPSLFHRRLIPLRGGSAISLNRARLLASEGRLYAGGEQTELCRDARRRGVTLLDAQTPEGRTVAASLGAIDLDRWGQRLARATDLPVLAAVASYLREHDERWRCAALPGLGERVATLDLRPLGSSRRIGDRLILVDTADPWLDEAQRVHAQRPNTAAFALLDHLLDHLDLGPERRARLLAPLAAAAVREAAGGPP